MNNFPIIPVTKSAKSSRRLIFGVGINDAEYLTQTKLNGKTVACPFYMRWKSMITRCYSSNYHKQFPTYKECTVCEEWLVFSVFKSWMKHQDWEENQLDKDLIVPGNKIYSPETCVFISAPLNYLLLDCGANRGKYKQGVHFNKPYKMFCASCCIDGSQITIGYFKTENEASSAYNKFKKEHVINIAMSQNNVILRQALLAKAETFSCLSPL